MNRQPYGSQSKPLLTEPLPDFYPMASSLHLFLVTHHISISISETIGYRFNDDLASGGYGHYFNGWGIAIVYPFQYFIVHRPIVILKAGMEINLKDDFYNDIASWWAN